MRSFFYRNFTFRQLLSQVSAFCPRAPQSTVQAVASA